MMFMCSNMLDEDEMSDNNPPIFVPPPSLGPPSSASAGGAVVVIEELDSRHNSNIGVFHHHNFLPPLISGGDDDLSGNVAGTGPRGGGDSPPSPFSSASTAADFSPSDWCWLEPSPPQPNLGPHQHQLPNNPSLFRQQHHTYAAAAAAATAAGFEQNNNAGGHPGGAYGGQHSYYQHYQPVQQQQQSSGGNTPPALGQAVHTTYVLRQQQQQQQQQQLHHPTAAAAVQQHFQRHRQRAEVGAAHLEQKQSLVVVVEAGGSDRDDEHGNNIDGNKLGDDEDGTAGDGTEDDMALLAEDGTQEAGGSGHTTRAAPETLAWLHANYESYPGASLPRCTLYEHYQNHCREIGLSPVNAASFGKLIRNSFKDLLTRRLGTRGNSKYHYSGIRIKPSSALLHEGFQRAQQNGPDASAPDEHQRHHSTPTARGTRRHGTRRATSHQQQAQKNAATATEPNSNSSGGTIDVAMMELDGAGAAPQRQQRGQSADFPLPDALSTPADALTFPRVSLPLDDSLDEALLPLGLTVQHALKFQMDYEAHNREVLECLRNLRLESVENVRRLRQVGLSGSARAG